MTVDFPMNFQARAGDTSEAEREIASSIDRITSQGRNQLRQFSTEAQALLDSALSVQRNDAGALNLQTSELREQLRLQEQRAVAAREVADATARQAAAQNGAGGSLTRLAERTRQYQRQLDSANRELREEIGLLDLVQRELDQQASAIDSVTAAQQRGTTATRIATNSQRAVRQAGIQAGQQLQDIVVQAEAGTRATTIFAQQVPQLAFALSGLANTSGRVTQAIGRVATFLAGPWGAAVFIATSVLGPYVAELFTAEEATEKINEASLSLAERLDFVARGYEEAWQAAVEYNRETAAAAQTTLQQAQAASIAAQKYREEAVARREVLQARLAQVQQGRSDLANSGSLAAGFGGTTQAALLALERDTQAALDRNQARIDGLTQTVVNTGFDLAIEQARIQGDAAAAIAESYSNAREELRGTVTDTDELRRELIRLNAEEQAALENVRRNNRSRSTSGNGRSRGDAEARRAALEAQRLAAFGADAAERIGDIRDRFTEVPPEVAKINTATRQLDDLISRVGEKEPPGFKKLIKEANQLRDDLNDFGLDESLDRNIQGFALTQDRALSQQRLILAGRDNEAEALRILVQLERQFGPIVRERYDDILDIIDARDEESEALDRLQEKQEALLGATRSFRQELVGLLSGQDTDFTQIFRNLQAEFTVEALFGDALRNIERSVKGSFEQAVDETEQHFETVGNAALQLAGTFDRARGLTDGVIPSGGLLGANDNDAGIVVEGVKEGQRGTVSGMSVVEYADLVGTEIAKPLLDNLPPALAESLSPVLSSALAGQFLAGTPGAVVGGLRGLFGTNGPLGDVLGLGQVFETAFEGLGVGSQINSVLGALGVGGSNSGSTIGGAAGAVAGSIIPGVGTAIGSAIGSVLGSLVGGLFGGTPRGSAIIGGSGANLAITGNFGGNNEREAAANTLGGEVISQIERIADQLGASVNASLGEVSIGIRNDNFRVDTLGRGFTRSSRAGVLDFGQDQDAAIAAAVEDLINDGVIQGLSAAEQRLFNQATSLEDRIADVLAFRGVFDRINESADPLRAEILALNEEFEGLIDLFQRAGASAEEFADLEDLYQRERAEAIERATEQVAGSLQSLLDDLLIGNSGLSLRDRRANAEADFDALRARVVAGDTTAFDAFEEAARALLDIERQIFGSQEEYFQRFNDVVAVSQDAINAQSDALNVAANLGSPFDSAANDNGINPIGVPIAEQTAVLSGLLNAVNTNLGTINQTLLNSTGTGGGRLIEERFAF